MRQVLRRSCHGTEILSSVFWANSGLGVVTLPDFWGMLHRGDLHIHRDAISSIKEDQIAFASGEIVQADGLVLCTGWGDHFGMFDDATKTELGLPVLNGTTAPESEKASHQPGLDWAPYDREAERSVDERLPFLASPPQAHVHHNDMSQQRKWRLYRRCVPISSALSGDRSIAIMGQIHTVQTPLVAEVQCFWGILYLLGEIAMPEKHAVMREIAEWNAWTKKRYLTQGQKFPYSLYDFMPVSGLHGSGRSMAG